MKTIRLRACFLFLCLFLCLTFSPSAFADNGTWSFVRQDTYGSAYNLHNNGCGIFALINAVGFLTGRDMGVETVAAWASQGNGYDTSNGENGGTTRGIFYPRAISKYGEEYGFTGDGDGIWYNGQYSNWDSPQLKNHLLGGGVAIGHTYGNGWGHFIAIVEYNSQTNQFHVLDSWPSAQRKTNTNGGDVWHTGSEYSENMSFDWFCLLSSTSKRQIVLHPAGGICGQRTITAEKNTAIGTLPTPTLDSYYFTGWYTEPYGGTRITSSTVVTENMTLYAHWTHGARYLLNYDTAGGVIPDDEQSRSIDGFDIWRDVGKLIIYQQTTNPDSNVWGVELAINSAGQVVDHRPYGQSEGLTVPPGGYIISGQDDGEGSPCKFLEGLYESGYEYFAIDYETGTLTAYRNRAAYIAGTKHIGDYDYYGELPIPYREGYIFDCWKVGDHRISESSQYEGRSLCASWIPDVLDTYNVYPTYLKLTTTDETSLMSLPCSNDTDPNSTQIRYLSKGKTFTATEVYVNPEPGFGICWYKGTVDSTGEAGYIVSTRCEITSFKVNTLSKSGGTTPPTTIPKANGYYVAWLVESEYLNIDTIQGYIYDSSGNASSDYCGGSEKTGINAKSYQLGSQNGYEPVDSNLHFSTLGPGSYTCSIKVKCLYYYGASDGSLQSRAEWRDLTSFSFVKQGDTDATAEQFISFARQYLGVPYVSAGRSPSGFDCCGFVWYVCNHFGIDIGSGNQSSQINYGTVISYSKSSFDTVIQNMQAGDLLYFDYGSNGSVDHVAIYTGNGNIINAENSGVKEHSLNQSGWPDGLMWTSLCGIRRVLVSSTDTTGSVMSTGAGRTIEDGDYIIASAVDPRYYLDIEGNDYPATSGTNVNLWGERADVLPDCDIWTVTYIDDGGFYSIFQKGTDMALDVTEASQSCGANIEVWGSNNGNAQKWSILPISNDSYRIQAKCSGFSMDISGKMSEVSNIQQWTTNDGIYQQWTFIPCSNTYFTVDYDANGGTGEPASQTKKHGESLTLSTITPTREDTSAGSYTVTLNVTDGGSVSPTSLSAARTTSYTFNNWNTEANGSGTTYAPGDTYSTDADMALYAQWNSNTTTATVNLPTPTRSGWSFKGWSTNVDATSGLSGVYRPSGDVTLYALWERNEYTTVNYNANGGTGAPDPQIITDETDLILSDVIPTREDQTESYIITLNANGGNVNPSRLSAMRITSFAFDSWNTMADGNGTSYYPAGIFTAVSDITLYAKWTTSVEEVAALLPTPTRSGYDFKGWAESSDAIEGITGYYTPESSVTLYAVWELPTYTVTYDANGGENAPEAQEKIPGTELILSSDVPTHAFWVFRGWAESADATEAAYLPGGRFTKDVNTTLYAVWTKPDFVLPDALTEIGEEAFANCGFTYVKLPENTDTIGKNAFANCPNLKYIYIPKDCLWIDRYAFTGVNGLTILGVDGSYAQTYASGKGFDFIAVS